MLLERAMNIELSDLLLEDDGVGNDPGACLHGAIRLGGAPFHVKAFAVVEDADGNQVSADPMYQSDIESIADLDGGAPLETVKVKGRDYALCIIPFCA